MSLTLIQQGQWRLKYQHRYAHLNDNAECEENVAYLEPTSDDRVRPYGTLRSFGSCSRHDEIDDIVYTLDVEKEHANDIVVAFVQTGEATGLHQLYTQGAAEGTY